MKDRASQMAKFAGRITAIEPQKKNKQRVSIFLDGEYAFGLEVFLQEKYHLKTGDVLREKQVKDLLLKEEKQRLRNKAFHYLALRAHGERELFRKLQQKGFDDALIGEVISELKASHYLDDWEFARAFVRNRLTHKPVGQRHMRHQLRFRGIADEIIEAVLKEIYAEVDPAKLAAELVTKRRTRYRNLSERERKRRLADFLNRRGFDWEIIRDVVEKSV